MRVCQNHTHIIDGRRANYNLASLGAQRPPRPSPAHEHGLFISSSILASFHFFSKYFYLCSWKSFEGMGVGRYRPVGTGLVAPPTSREGLSSVYIHQQPPHHSYPYTAAYGLIISKEHF